MESYLFIIFWIFIQSHDRYFHQLSLCHHIKGIPCKQSQYLLYNCMLCMYYFETTIKTKTQIWQAFKIVTNRQG